MPQTPDPHQSDPYNRSGFRVLMFSMVFSLGFFAYISFGVPPIDLQEIDPDQSTGAPPLAQQVEDYATPWVEVGFMQKYGQKIYAVNCASCHGPTGLGDGAAGAALPVKPRSLVEGQWQHGGSSVELFNTITNGIAGSTMASFKHLKPKDRWALVQMIRQLTQNKVPDDAKALQAFGQGTLE